MESRGLRNWLRIMPALLALYFIWGSTYLGIKFALGSFPPMLILGIRYTTAGSVLYLFLRLRGGAAPTRRQWLNAAIIGTLMIVFATGGVAIAEQWVASGMAALMITATPLLASIFAGFWGTWPSRVEWLALFLGLSGVGLLNLQGDLRASPLGSAILLFASCNWAFASIWSRHLNLPDGLMASAAEMLFGGGLSMLLSLLFEEGIRSVPTTISLLSLAYLTLFGSLLGFSVYGFLLREVRPALATSYAYVNPIVAVLLGWALANEPLTSQALAAAVIIIASVLIVNIYRIRHGGEPKNTSEISRMKAEDIIESERA